jgi:hypothetical protein
MLHSVVLHGCLGKVKESSTDVIFCTSTTITQNLEVNDRKLCKANEIAQNTQNNLSEQNCSVSSNSSHTNCH